MKALSEIELHDAVLKRFAVDHEQGIATIELDLYENEDDRNRRGARITFSEVEAVAQIVDMHRMKDNSSAGNINQWVPSLSAGTTYIYLVDGCISVTANTVKVEFL